MMAKCVEAAAIRKAWPNETAGSYVAEEMDAPHTIELKATEIVETFATEQRLKQVGAANALLVQWEANGPIVQVPLGRFGDEAIAFIQRHREEPMTVALWEERNRFALKEYWARDKAGALAVKTELEALKQESSQ